MAGRDLVRMTFTPDEIADLQRRTVAFAKTREAHVTENYRFIDNGDGTMRVEVVNPFMLGGRCLHCDQRLDRYSPTGVKGGHLPSCGTVTLYQHCQIGRIWAKLPAGGRILVVHQANHHLSPEVVCDLIAQARHFIHRWPV